jgi:SAM-dependent methyltransferase
VSDSAALIPSDRDVAALARIRENVSALMSRAGSQHAAGPARLLDIAPQDHEGARPYFPAEVAIETLDIDPSSGCTHIGDICGPVPSIEDGRFDYVVCTEVLEHVLQPFDAAAEIRRMLRPGGRLFLSTPFDFRIHGPLPDCWRFTEHGLRALLVDFRIVELAGLDAPERPLMPLHYTVVAERP